MAGEVKIIPAYDAVFDEPAYSFHDLCGHRPASEALLPNASDAGRERKTEEVGEAEYGLVILVRVSGMDIAFDDIIVHEIIDDIGAFASSRADHQRML